MGPRKCHQGGASELGCVGFWVEWPATGATEPGSPALCCLQDPLLFGRTMFSSWGAREGLQQAPHVIAAAQRFCRANLEKLANHI